MTRARSTTREQELERAVLAAIDVHGPQYVVDLAERLQATFSEIGGACSRLRSAGRIEFTIGGMPGGWTRTTPNPQLDLETELEALPRDRRVTLGHRDSDPGRYNGRTGLGGAR